NSKCNPRTRPVERQYTVPRQRFETPHFNASYIDHNLTVSGQHRCFVSEFFPSATLAPGPWSVSTRCRVSASRRRTSTPATSTTTSQSPASIGASCQSSCKYNSKCNPRTRPVERQYTVPRQRFETPHFNASYIDHNLTVSGQHRCFVSEFLLHWPLQEDSTFRYKIKGTYHLSLLNIFERETFFYRANMLARKFINTQLCDFGCD
ncbi:Silk protein P25, partial [Operophtera brumata]